MFTLKLTVPFLVETTRATWGANQQDISQNIKNAYLYVRIKLTMNAAHFWGYECMELYRHTHFMTSWHRTLETSLLPQWPFLEQSILWHPMGLTVGVQFPAEARDFSLLHSIQTGFVAHPASYPMGTGSSFPTGKVARVWSWPLTSISCPIHHARCLIN
jgi:hypothetical protein